MEIFSVFVVHPCPPFMYLSPSLVYVPRTEFLHENEVVKPGYYAVDLDSQITVRGRVYSPSLLPLPLPPLSSPL